MLRFFQIILLKIGFCLYLLSSSSCSLIQPDMEEYNDADSQNGNYANDSYGNENAYEVNTEELNSETNDYGDITNDYGDITNDYTSDTGSLEETSSGNAGGVGDGDLDYSGTDVASENLVAVEDTAPDTFDEGSSEKVVRFVSQESPIYTAANAQSSSSDILTVGSVLIVSISGEWAKISDGMYVPKSILSPSIVPRKRSPIEWTN